VLAVHFRESNGIFATIQSSEGNMFRGKLLCRKFSKCFKCHKYAFKYVLEIVQGEIKQWFLTVYFCVIGPYNSTEQKKRKLISATSALVLPPSLC
jgi:hypothetical protein